MEPSHELQWSPLLGFVIGFFLFDVLFYGVFVPICGASIGSYLAAKMCLGPYWEMWTVIGSVVGIFLLEAFIYGHWVPLTVSLNLEVRFWKKLFSNERGYRMLLRVIKL